MSGNDPAYKNYIGPTFGRVAFNLKYAPSKVTDSNFENAFEIVVHEILHIMGISGGLFPYWLDAPNGNRYKDLFEVKKLRG